MESLINYLIGHQKIDFAANSIISSKYITGSNSDWLILSIIHIFGLFQIIGSYFFVLPFIFINVSTLIAIFFILVSILSYFFLLAS